VCGDDALAFRLAGELVQRHHGQVVVVIRSADGPYLRRIAGLDSVRVIEWDGSYTDAFTAAHIAAADALALVERNDVANIDAALSAHEMCPGLRMVVRMFNTSLGEGLAELPYCTVLSDGAIAAPAFVAAALGEATPTLRLHDNTLFVGHRSEVSTRDTLCGLATTAGRDEPELLPANQAAADLVLARAAPTTAGTVHRRPGLTNRYPIGGVLARVWRRLRIVLAVFVGLLFIGAGVLLAVRPEHNWWAALYTSVLVVVGSGDANADVTTAEQVTITALAMLGIALVPLLTATVVDAVVKTRLELAQGWLSKPASDHVVVVGLGGIGSHVIRALHDRGVDVVAIDRSADARGAQVARDLRIPLIVGDASRKEILQAASVSTCRSLMVITSDDVTNLETALAARGIRRDLRVVLRLFDGDMAARVQHAFDIADSHSVSYLAVPSFAARMLGRDLDTVPVGRHVLLVATLTVGAYAPLEDRTVRDVWRPNEAWLCELTNPLGQRLESPAGGRRIRRGDKLLVVATRNGLARLVAETTAPPESAPRPPIVLHDALPPGPVGPNPNAQR
jgi:Trk K+ transport system NAD-binding subunit